MASRQLFDAVPFFAGLSLDLIGGRGVRWPASEAAGALGATPWEPVELSVPPLTGDRRRRRSCGSAPGARCGRRQEVDHSPVLRFMRPRQVVELSPVDAERLGVRDGDQVEVGSNGTRVRGAARLRAAVPAARCSSSRARRRSRRTC